MSIGLTDGVGMYEYHAMNDGVERGSPDYIVSRSDLKEISNHNPEYWRKGGNPPSSEAIKTGALVDALVTEPHRYKDLFEVLEADRYPPRYQAKEKELGRYLVKAKDVEKHEAMAASLRAKRVEEWDGLTVGEVIDGADTQTMATTTFTASGVTVHLRALIDVNPVANWLGDVKTSRSIDSRGWYNALRYEQRLAMQSAFYLDVYNAANFGICLNLVLDDPQLIVKRHFLHLLVHSEKPHQAAVRMPDEEFLAEGRAQYQEALRQYCMALASGEWPGYPNAIETVSMDRRVDWIQRHATQ